MRFHFGLSFSLKKLKKFIFPILIGILSYFFGGNLFGCLNVYATSYDNYDTTYNITLPELDFSTFNIDSSHTFQEFLDTMVELGNNSTNYDLIIGVNSYPNFNDLSAFSFSLKIFPKGLVSENGYNLFYGENMSYPYFNFLYNYNLIYGWNSSYFVGLTFSSFPFGNDFTLNSTFINIKNCLEGNSCSLNFTSSRHLPVQYIELAHNKPLFNNNSSYDIDLSNSSTYYHSSSPFLISGQMVYYSSFPLIFNNNSSYSDTRYNNFFKSLIINSQTYSPGDRIPTYCELYELCSASSPTLSTYNKLDDLFVSNIPVNNYSNLEVKFSLDYFLESFSSNFMIQLFTYGRVNNGTYFSYEPINCSLTGGSAFGDFKMRSTYHISNCQGDLTRYDSLIARFRMASGVLVNNFQFSTNLGHIAIAPVFNGSNSVEIMDYFGGLSPDFSVLISSPDKDSNLEYIGNDTYTLAQRINKSTNDISMLAQTGIITFGTNTNSNIMLYNYSLQNNTNTDLYLFFSEGVIIKHYI